MMMSTMNNNSTDYYEPPQQEDDDYEPAAAATIHIFSDEQLLAYSICTRCAAAFSLLCSVYLAVAAFRNRSRIYHRLMLGLALHLILFNAWHIYGSWAIPANSPAAPPTAVTGTTATCTAQGFGFQISYAVSFYYVFLSLYSFLAVRHNFEVSKYVWVEKWIHLAVHVFPVGSAFWLLRLEAYNFAGNGVVCWIDSIPHGCGDGTAVPCTRGPQNITQVAALGAALPTFFVLVFPTAIMVALYCSVKRRQNHHHPPSGSHSRSRMAPRIEAKTVAKQAALYLCALYWSYSFTMIATGIRLVADQHIYGLAVLSTVNLNLLGFYILLIYLYFRQEQPTTENNNNSDNNNNTTANNNSSAAAAVEQSTRSPGELEDHNHNNDHHHCSSSSTQQTCAAATFNIFDGSNPTGDFADFIFDGDSEDEALDQQESARWSTIQEHV